MQSPAPVRIKIHGRLLRKVAENSQTKTHTAPVLNLCRDNAISRVSRREVVGHARGDVNSKWPLRALCLSTIVTHTPRPSHTHVRALWEKQTGSWLLFLSTANIFLPAQYIRSF